MTADARRRAEEALAEYDRLWGAAHATNAYGRAVVGLASALRALLAAGPEAKTPVTTPVPWLECLTVISNPIVPQGAILIHPDTLAGKPDALAYRPPDPLPQPAPITPPPPGDAVREAAERLRASLVAVPSWKALLPKNCGACEGESDCAGEHEPCGCHETLAVIEASRAILAALLASEPAPPAGAEVREAVSAAAELLSAVRSARKGSIGAIDNTYLPQIGREWLRPIEERIDAGISALAALRATASPAPGSDGVREAEAVLAEAREALDEIRRRSTDKLAGGIAASFLGAHPRAALRDGQKGGE